MFITFNSHTISKCSYSYYHAHFTGGATEAERLVKSLTCSKPHVTVVQSLSRV